jgi:benzodiazapine receptor
MKRVTLQQILVLVSVIATLVVNGLATSLPLNDLTPGEISDQFEVFFVPAGYVFSIWGLIYIGLIAYGIYQILPKNADSSSLTSISWLFIGSSAANIVWLFLWHYTQFVASLIAMLALLVFLILIYERLWRVRKQASRVEFWAVHVLFQVYLGWITVATIANATTVLDYIGWSGWGIGDAQWAVVMLVIATIIGSAVILRRQDPAYGLVLVWAFVGIANKHAGSAPVDLAAWVTAGAVLLVVLIQSFRLMRKGVA